MRVLLATDGSAHSEAALDLLARIPVPAHCQITLLTVTEAIRPLFAGEHPFAGAQVNAAFREFRDKLQAGAQRLLRREQQRLQER